MIYTVTLTPALDKTVVIPDFTVDKVNRIGHIRLDPGGKGINVSKVLRALGMDSLATGILGGSTGHYIERQLEKMGIGQDFVQVPEETRTNLKVIDPEKNTHTDINEPGAPVSKETLDEVLARLLGRVVPGDRVVLAGKAPQGAPDTVFADWTKSLKDRGVFVYMDADAGLLIQGAKALPAMIKPNDEELCRLVGRALSGRKEMAQAAKALCAGGIGTVAVSLGADGALFVRGGEALYGKGLAVPVQSTVGAGDAMMAAFCFGDERGEPFAVTCARALAVSAAEVMQSGTQPPNMQEILPLMDRVELESC